MAMMLPGWLAEALQFLGYEWPSTNEDTLAQYGGRWMSLASSIDQNVQQMNSAVQHVVANNQGPGVQAFAASMSGGDSNLASMRDLSTASRAIGICSEVGAGIVVGLKGLVIAQLVILAAAIAGAIMSAGLGAGAALAAREVAKRLVDAAINLAVNKIMGG